MRRLSISLLIVVLLAIVGFGWALDRLFVILQPNVADRLAPYRAMGAAIVSSTYAGADLDAFIATWPEDSSLSISKLNTNAVALPRELLEPFSRGETLELEGDTGVTLMFPLERRDFALTLSIPPATTENESVVRFTLTIVFYTGVILLILLWVYPLVRRLHALSKAANRFGAGDFSSRVPLSRYSLIENIETEFNAMADRIAMLVEDNRLLSNAVSHDLRTPLARLRFGVDALSEEEDPAVQERYMQRISSDLAEMEHLVEVLLDYARLEKQKSALPLQPMAIAPRVTERINAVFGDATHKIDWETPSEELYVMANERYIDMVINNILQNALRYGESHVRVSLRVEQREKSVARKASRNVSGSNSLIWLVVEDDGPGIPEDERSRVLKPFERGRANTERVRPNTANANGSVAIVSSGFGMGLAIVQRILDWHGATLVLGSSQELGGASVQMGFQSAQNAQLD